MTTIEPVRRMRPLLSERKRSHRARALTIARRIQRRGRTRP